MNSLIQIKMDAANLHIRKDKHWFLMSNDVTCKPLNPYKNKLPCLVTVCLVHMIRR